METQQFEQLASRWVAGDRLAPDEEQILLDWLENHPEARHTLIEDESLDSLLCCWPRLEETAENFVRGCVHRAVDQRTSPREPASVVAAPPIVPPPIVRPGESITVGLSPFAPRKSRSFAERKATHVSAPVLRPIPRNRRLFAGGAGRWLTVAAGCSAAILLAMIGWRWLAPGPKAVGPNLPETPLADGGKRDSPLSTNTKIGTLPDKTFATLAQSTGAKWEVPRSEGDRLAAGVLKLTSGTAELHFDKGTVARLAGPAELDLRSVDEVLLKSGSLTARVPSPAVGFAVVTPLARIVDLGTEFDVAVNDAGATQTFVRRGRVSLRPQRGQEDLGSPIELAVGELDRARVSVPNVAALVPPVMTVARGSQGQFLARVSAHGKTAEFHTQAAFRAFRTRALRQLREDPDQFGQKWPGLVDRAGGAEKAGGAGRGVTSEPNSAPDRREPPPPKGGGAGEDQTVEIQENGKSVSITDSKESGITVTITESEGGKKKTTKVRAADTAELARKDPEAHRYYRQYFHPRPKNVKPRL